jgi:hypothetical protein
MYAMTENIHGRTGGRGLRPWLLIPKYFCVSFILGGLLAMLILCLTAWSFPAETDQRAAAWRLIGPIFWFQVIPATVLTILLGIALLAQHFWALIRMRWLLLKIPAVVIVVPLSHWYFSNSVDAYRTANLSPTLLALPLALSLAAFCGIAILGRLKPRLGQKYTPAAPPESPKA